MPARTSVATVECRFSISKNSETAPCSRRFHAPMLLLGRTGRENCRRLRRKWRLPRGNAPLVLWRTDCGNPAKCKGGLMEGRMSV